jgi:hypothetical protein
MPARYLRLAAVVLFVLPASIPQLGCSSKAAGTIQQVVLQPSKSFRLSSTLRMEDAAADPDGNLYFLLSDHGQQFEVIRTNDFGEVNQTMVVPPPTNSSLRKITAASMGRIAVLFIQSNMPDIIDICDGPSGRVLGTFSPDQKLADFSYVGSQLIGLTVSGRLVNLNSVVASASTASPTVLPQPALMAAVDDQRVAVVGMVTALLQFTLVNSQTTTNPVALVAPEIQSVERPQIDPAEGGSPSYTRLHRPTNRSS